MINTGFKRVVVLGAITLIGIIAFQVNWVYNAYTLSDQQFTQSINISLINVAENIAEFNKSQLPSRQPIKQISSNYFVVELNDKIDPQLLEHYLVEEFKKKNIHLNFEYSIYDCETDEMVYGRTVNLNEKKLKQKHAFPFQKYEHFTYYFGIRFPSKTLMVLRKTNTWLISAFILLGAIVFYTYSLIVIKKQKKISQIQKDFINNMAHEFKTPISTISIASNYIINNSNELKTKEYGNIIDLQNKKLEKQIENILTASLAENHKIKLNLDSVSPAKVVNEVIAVIEPKLKEKEGNIKINDCPQSIAIKADAFHFSNAMYNILENAIKFTNEKPEITIDFSENGNLLKIEISDNGIGIEKKYQQRVFKKFYRVNNGDVHNTKGFGIGLNYVKNIVKAHNWKIKIWSEVNKGTTVKLIMPIHDKKG